MVPHGFNNNIIWNTAHLVAAQQFICYIRPGLSAPLPEELYMKYASGTRPEKFVESDEEDEIKKLLLTSIDQLERDYQQNVFQAFKPWTTRFTNFDLRTINDSITYLNYHEGLHMGVITSIKKLVQK
jgi:hypothetical protein